ncbi:MAG: peptidoglycan editing factor PgeF [Nitrospirota bacterium]
MNDLIFPDLPNGSVKAFFTTKRVGVDKNRICSMLSVETDCLYMPVQKHTDRIEVLNHEAPPGIADGVVSNRRGVLVGVRVADCVPVLLFDKDESVIAAVHAGWRGTAAGILKKAVSLMVERFGSSPDNILVALGPSIGQCCYAVGPEVMEAVIRATGDGDFYSSVEKKYMVDLGRANRIQATSTGIPPGNIWLSGECTCCNPERFYSYRYSKEYDGSQGGFIGIL